MRALRVVAHRVDHEQALAVVRQFAIEQLVDTETALVLDESRQEKSGTGTSVERIWEEGVAGGSARAGATSAYRMLILP